MLQLNVSNNSSIEFEQSNSKQNPSFNEAKGKILIKSQYLPMGPGIA